jgi:hypothetical protein
VVDDIWIVRFRRQASIDLVFPFVKTGLVEANFSNIDFDNFLTHK